MFIVSHWFLKFFTRGFASAITLWPFIILNSKKQKMDMILVNHEKIHLAQQLELGIIFFYVIYFGEFLFYRIKGFNKQRAYQSISFEKEAYANECNIDYLNSRELFDFRKYW